MKVLLVTGLLAEEIVKGYIKESPIDAEVLALKVPVAAFLTPEIAGLKTKLTAMI